ncbi:hypothetical protein [Mycobacterium avium]|uniref:Uncharacterized protein n=1 Tax=Mycobacterium avium subsp. hominissuis TaxID=439334 RepID=A0AAI8SI61_MYCAV|nr:hypothetical protein [Mycobacterium avium]MBZ4573250.1 hypothetical protein [Mycobacterium avium subsp. hominissuis]MCA2238326.1 hypothetical protein [Mycobacterium avium]MCA2260607.1 hypothetical protein [Mycobacterium avium]MCA2271244.1 hypothetical protein [Mycobacterium avium]MCA2284491.1 hypothetical protein [Mycobacterium avium]
MSMADFSRLSASWIEWSDRAHLTDVSVSTECPDCEVRFSSKDQAVHLRYDGAWWIVDSVDDRGQRHSDEAKFSSFELAEKYLIWLWANSARGIVGAPRLGPRLYALGYNPNIETIPIAEGVADLKSPNGQAILMEPYATIFSHLMLKSADEVEQMVREGIA